MTAAATKASATFSAPGLVERLHRAMAAIPESLIALLARFSIAAVF